MTSVLDEILKYGKRRRAEFFPEGIPGLNPLSKTETHHDLDSMAVSDSLSPSRNGAFRRRGNGRANVTSAGISERSGIEVPANYPIVKVPEGRVSKRSRLIQKIVHEGKANQDLQAKEKEMRTALESLREENLLLKMEINKFDCEMNGLSSELNQKKNTMLLKKAEYEKRVQEDKLALKQVEENVRQYQDFILEVNKKEIALNEEMRSLRSFKEMTMELQTQKTRLETALRDTRIQLKVSQEARRNSVENPQLVEIMEETNRLSNELKQTQDALDDANRNIQSLNLLLDERERDLSVKTELLERCNSELKAFSDEKLKLVSEIDELKEEKKECDRMVDMSKKEIQIEKDRYSSIKLVYECSEKRLRSCESHLNNVTCELGAFHSALQEHEKKYTKMFDALSSSEDEKIKLKLELTSMKKNLATMSRASTHLRNENVKLEAKCKHFEEQMSSHSNQVLEKDRRIHELEAEILELREKVSDMEDIMAAALPNEN